MSKDFRRQEKYAEKRVNNKAWRKPRGINSKMRMREGGKAWVVKVGHRTNASTRGFHPSGFKEMLVHNEKQLDTITKLADKKTAVRIASSVGGKKRAAIIKKADDAKIKILNR
ncbi:MAG: eL32 family ribosomal protein [Candidatus Aenigmatarchaeota archaeon]